MADPPVLTINRAVRRPDPALVAGFAGAPTGFVADAQGRQGALAHALRPVTRATRFAGPALTVKARPIDNLACWAALEWVKPGDVVVVATGGGEEAAVVGDNFVGMAKNCGAVAVVTDGLVRDVPGLDEIGLPVVARGVTPNSPWKDGPGEIGLAVSLGGVVIRAGDVLVGDGDGVVVVPQETLRKVLDELAAVTLKEGKMEAAIRAGQKVPAWLPETLRAKGVRYIDE
jgi:4-hydroxy-4-methyl-2-oxoglutarate aldolase